MKLGLLPLLACPDCGGEIRFSTLRSSPRLDLELESGTLACRGCGREFEIAESVPRMFPAGAREGAVESTRSRFGWEWLRYPAAGSAGARAPEEDLGIFLEETQLPEPEWRGRLALDAGCGMGRYALAALRLGAEVVALDLSDAVLRLLPRARQEPRLHLLQGDLLRPPLKPMAFDAVYSQGVLHHTQDTRSAFRAVAPLVKRGGYLSVWVYGTPGSYRSFSTNPLRRDRGWLRRPLPLLWAAVWLRQLLSDGLRLFTVRLPTPLLYALCYPLAVLGAVPGLKYLTFSVHPRFKVRVIENFDWLAPPYQHKHVKEEVAGWFEEAGCAVLSLLPHGVVPKVGVLGRRLK